MGPLLLADDLGGVDEETAELADLLQLAELGDREVLTVVVELLHALEQEIQLGMLHPLQKVKCH